ncbi:hypothetical protein B0T25DRAFT_582492 [Lasiosphaeria hispida]|uniref:Uncharacterized protein n=1 Tax=Lasiosphaeria hispida TaxID=260671 RepID=A0AAJ0MCG1_9PEZI|nr:hypothetical protein B0T25DRAFT_582492 [Lasiosphaeria hispida]
MMAVPKKTMPSCGGRPVIRPLAPRSFTSNPGITKPPPNAAMTRIHLFILLVASIASLVSASAQTFCKCTCFTNSVIIGLGPQHDAPDSSSPDPNSPPPPLPLTLRNHHPLPPRAASSSCAQCNRAFCLKYNLPICKDAEEKDVVTSCFQRDSRKDQIIVWGFILGTAGLLGWAGARRLLEWRESASAASSRPGGAAGTGASGLLGRVIPGAGGRAYSPLDDSGIAGGRAG